MWTQPADEDRQPTTGNGSLISRMGDASNDHHRGWDLFIDSDKLVVHIVNHWPQPGDPGWTPAASRAASGSTSDSATTDPARARASRSTSTARPVNPTSPSDTLQPGDTIRNNLPLNLGRAVDSDRCARHRVRRRAALPSHAGADEEFARLPFEDLTAGLLARSPDPDKWSSTERFLGLERYLPRKRDPEAAKLRAEIDGLDRRIEEIGKDGPPR